MNDISIITATYNAAATLADNLACISSQRAPVEHLIMDGGSTDGTGEIVKAVTRDSLLVTGDSATPQEETAKHQTPITRFLSEPDNGIYDAMNKGLRLATGDIIGILNADDFYADDRVLERVAKVFEDPSVEACYGDLVYVKDLGNGQGARGYEQGNGQWAMGNGKIPSDGQSSSDEGTPGYGENPGNGENSGNGQLAMGYGEISSDDPGVMGNGHQSPIADSLSPEFKILRYWKSGPFHPDKFRWGWMPPHPTFFVRRSVYEKYGLFNLDLGSAADYELMLRFLLKHRIKVAYIPEVLVCMRAGGVSNASLGNRLKANQMDRKAWEVNGLRPYPWTLAMKPVRKIPQYWLRPSEAAIGKGR